MKFYECIRKEKEKTIKILGFPIMVRTTDYMTGERYQSFFNGLISTVKTCDKNIAQFKKDIKICGLRLFKRTEEDNHLNYHFLGIKFYSVSLIKNLKRRYFKYFDKKHDDIYIFRANSGEIYLTLSYLINILIKKNGSKNPLLVATKKYHIDMIRMFCPNIPYVYINNFKMEISDDMVKIDNFRFFFLFTETYFKQVEMEIKSHQLGEFHYFKSILNHFKLSSQDIEINKVVILPEAEKSMLEKVKEIGLDINKFVFLSPEAETCKLYDEDFWIFLIKALRKSGYDVYVNLVKNDTKLKQVTDCKGCSLTYAEAFALAKRAKKIVSLRSGFTEFLLRTDVLIDVLYTKFRRRDFLCDMDIYQVISGFGLSVLPFVDKTKIREINTFEISPKDCIEMILKDL